MATITRKMKELRNADVRFISLVDRAASRIPFRVLKREGSDMGIDLMGLGKRVFKGDRQVYKPEITAVVVASQGDATVSDQIRQSIATAGFVTDQVQKSDGGNTTVYTQGVKVSEKDDIQLIRLSGDTLLQVKGFDEPSGIFSGDADGQKFYPGLSDATQMFHDEMVGIVAKSDNPRSEISDLLSSFGDYLNKVVSLPTSCFKADWSVQEIVKKCGCGEDKKVVAAKDSEEETESAKEKEKEKEESKKSDEEEAYKIEGCSDEDMADMKKRGLSKDEMVAEVAKKKKDKEDSTTKAEVVVVKDVEKPEVVTKTDLQQLLEALGGLKESTSKMETKFTSLATKVDEVMATQVEQKKVLDATVQKADALKGVLDTTVVASARGEDRATVTEVTKKSEDDDPRTGSFDTGMMRRRSQFNGARR